MAGSWMFHCHVDEHMMTGMMTEYTVLERKADGSHADQGQEQAMTMH